MKKKYYGIAGTNGYGVYDDYTKVLAAREYLKKFREKGFASFQAAKAGAEDAYYDLNRNWCDYKIAPIEKLNWTYYAKRAL